MFKYAAYQDESPSCCGYCHRGRNEQPKVEALLCIQIVYLVNEFNFFLDCLFNCICHNKNILSRYIAVVIYYHLKFVGNHRVSVILLRLRYQHFYYTEEIKLNGIVHSMDQSRATFIKVEVDQKNSALEVDCVDSEVREWYASPWRVNRRADWRYQ